MEKREWFEHPLLDGLEHSDPAVEQNYLKIPVTRWTFVEDEIEMFNELYKWAMNEPKLVPIKRAPKGGLAVQRPSARWNRWDIRQMNNMRIELTFCLPQGSYRIQLCPNPAKVEKEKHIYSGAQAFRKFKKICKKAGIDLDSMAIDNGEEINETIESPMIVLLNEELNRDMMFKRVHHLDFRSSYASGLMLTNEIFKPVLTKLYEQRKIHPEYKDLLNMSIGYMHSPLCKYKWAHLAKAAIANSNQRIRDMLLDLKISGREPILINTDGIWYQGELYHDDHEGVKMGDWHHDYMNCTIRCKSKGAYEFIDGDGVYHPVIRGKTKLDSIKPRTEWQWGDIYKHEAEELRYEFVEGKGVMLIEKGS